MTASYLLATFAAVLLIEALAVALVLPNTNQQAALSSRVLASASDYANRFTGALQKLDSTPSDPASGAARDQLLGELHKLPIGETGSRLGPGQEKALNDGVLIPAVRDLLPDTAPMSLAVILSPTTQIYASSYPERYSPGALAAPWLPAGWAGGGGGTIKFSNGSVVWATQPIFKAVPSDSASQTLGKAQPAPQKGDGKGLLDKPAPLGYAYVQVPYVSSGPSFEDLKPQLQTGTFFLLATVPVGVLFGMLTTRGMIRRLRRLAAGTVGFAEGDFTQRVPAQGRDEVGQLERHFNDMAARLEESITEQRSLAERNARLAERSRISRELHDSISQDLFSMSALVAGLRKALPADSEVQPQLNALAGTVGSTIQEMHALLLELRPTALEEKGLLPALADLCDAYEVRVGVKVSKQLEPVSLLPAAEQAIFRIGQEGLSNAVRHSEAEEVSLRLRAVGDRVELTVADRGRGFDAGQPAGHGLGLKLMAERVSELGGTLAIESKQGKGTVLRVLLPSAAAA